MQETLDIIRDEQTATMIAATFGHLAPRPNNDYNGWILFALTAWGETNIIDFELENISASPWLNIDILDYISDFTKKLPKDKIFGVFRFNGEYKKFKNGNCRFKGKITEIQCVN